MKRIALVMPNFPMRSAFGEISDPPIGIASIAAVLEREKREIIIVDAMGENLTIEQVMMRLRDFKPEAVGISCNYCVLHNSTLQLAERIKLEYGQNIFVFVGGNHASSLSEELVIAGHGNINCIARGEGETVTTTLLAAIETREHLSKVPGITYLDESGKAIKNPNIELMADLETIPHPAYHLLPMRVYQRYNLISMRGCPYNCNFCASTAIFTRKVRYRTPQFVADEVEYLLNNYGKRHFWFSDDTFTVNRAHTIELLDTIMERQLNISWSCLTTVNMVREDLLEKMKSSGCKYISYGIESGNPDILKQEVGKTISVDGIIETSRLSHKVGLTHYGFFIFGFPKETKETIMDTYKLIYESELDGGGMNILIPLPGTKLWERLYTKENRFTLSEMQWDQLFARLPNNAQQSFSAHLASRWCSLTPDELLEACHIGQKLFNIFKQVKGTSPNMSDENSLLISTNTQSYK